MRILYDLTLSIDENASRYFEKAKKAKRKLEGAKEAIAKQRHELAKLEKQQAKQQEREQVQKRKKEWYEKFRWFFSSEGFLCIGGRDATTNEIVIKKHTEKADLVFHTDMAGSPFFVIKNPDAKEIAQQTKEEVAQATAAFSKAWKSGMTTLDVFYVKPEQVTKEAQSGEFLGKGSFMVYGKSTYLRPQIELAIANTQKGVMCASYAAVSKYATSPVFRVLQGRDKPSDCAKILGKSFGVQDMDEIIRVLPSGTMQLKKA